MLKPFLKKEFLEIGCDEAGRGCLAGPVFAAAVIWNPKLKNKFLNDSKQLSEKKRTELRNWIEENCIYSVALVDEKTIDKINILNASILAMHNALDKINTKFNHIIVDGNRFKPYKNINHTTIIKGDEKYLSIAAASILAKTYRDEYMLKLDLEYPNYDWKKNKGYPTQKHREAIKIYGSNKYHRLSFKLLSEQLTLF